VEDGFGGVEGEVKRRVMFGAGIRGVYLTFLGAGLLSFGSVFVMLSWSAFAG